MSETSQPNESTVPATIKPTASKVEEVRPSVIYLPDKQGNLQAVLDFKYEDFIELYKLKQRLESHDERPRYSIERMSISGTAGAENAELTIQFKIMIRDGDWVRIPLRLERGLLREPAQYSGPGDFLLHYEDNGDGYVSWIRSKKEGQHEITLKLLVHLVRVGEETRLKLSTPRATSAELKIKVPEINAEGTVSEGATLLPPSAAQQGGTLFTVLGLEGDLQLAWHKIGDRVAEVSTVLEATANILARLDNQGISSEAILTVRSYGSPFDRFVVRLPPDADFTPVNTSNYSILPLEGKNDGENRRKLVEVRLNKKTTGPVEVRLSTRRDISLEPTSDGLDLAGFEVVGAARQWGAIAVAAGNDRQVFWGSHRGVRQVDLLPESLKAEGVVAGFEYSAFPFSLNATLAPRKTRINIDPEYIMYVEQDRVRLEAKLTCFIRGAKINVLRIAMPDWELDDAGPENVVAADGIDRDENGQVSILLKQPSSGKLELHFTAHKWLEKSADAFSLALPAPQVLSPTPAIVAVVPADNIELTPDAKSIQGLIRQQIAPPLKLPERQQDALFYRSEGKNAVFAATTRVHPGRITAEAENYIHLEEGSAQVEQKFIYSIAYEEVDQLLLEVPENLAGLNHMEILHDEKPLTAKILNQSDGVSISPGLVRMRVSLPEPSIGQFVLILRYKMNLPPPEMATKTPWSLPLVMPVNDQLSVNKLYLTAAPSIKIVSYDDAWRSLDQDTMLISRQNRLEFQSDNAQHKFDLDVQLEDSRTTNTTVVERAWIQTWLTLSARQDRAVYQFTTNQKELVFHLPVGTALEQMLVMLDGKRIEPQAVGETGFSLPLTEDGEIHSYLLELRYHIPGRRPPQGLASIDFPLLATDVWTRRMYWQLILPQNEHVLINPPGLIGEYRWKWCGYFWGREPLLNQTQLESWIGTSQHALLPEGANIYLYSALGNVDRAEFHTIGRTLIVSIASGAALILGLMLIYVPLVRHPFSLLVLSIVLLSLAMIYPEPAVMIAQASGLGLALTLMAGLLERSMARRRKDSGF